MLLKTKAEEHPIKKLDETQTVNFEDATLGMYNGDWDRLGAACVIVDMQHCKPENLWFDSLFCYDNRSNFLNKILFFRVNPICIGLVGSMWLTK